MKKTKTIKNNYDFVRIYKSGRFCAGVFIVLYIKKNNIQGNRIGITASKKVGNSVKRNRLRRLIKENYRMYESLIKEGYDCVFVVRNYKVMPNFFDIKKEMKFLLNKLCIINK